MLCAERMLPIQPVLFDDIWKTTQLLDKLALITADAFQATREKFIARQQEELMELSTPVVKLWDGILALPIIGTLDSARTQVVMESLLQAVVQTNSRSRSSILRACPRWTRWWRSIC